MEKLYFDVQCWKYVFVLVVKMQRIRHGLIHTLEISSTQDCTVLRLVLWLFYQGYHPGGCYVEST